jgi:hypothetical protein
MAQVRIWAILGEQSVGKSTTIGHLIGDFGRGRGGLRPAPGGLRQVLLRGGGYLTVYARRRSWSEARQTPDQVIRTIKQQNSQLENRPNPRINAGYFNVLMALRTDRLGTFPIAADYLSRFVALGWTIESLALLSPEDRDVALYHRFGAPICYIYDSREIQIAWMVGQVRNHFGWA